LIGFIPGSSAISSVISSGWSKLLPWFAIHVVRLSGSAASVYVPGADTLLGYVMYVFLLLTAAIATLAWSLGDSKRRNYATLDSWLRLAVCYYLIYWMLRFGINKVIPLQFVFPNLNELLTPVGFHSLRNLFWALMGASPGYVMFCGATEVLAALLLIFKRTRTLGAIVTAAVLTNVVAVNYGYDVGVKLFSSHLLLMAIFLVAPHGRTLADVFIRNQAARISEADPFESRHPFVRMGAMCAKVILLGFLIFDITAWNWKNYKRTLAFATDTPVYGIFEVEGFTRNGQEVPPTATDGSRWRKVILQTPTGVVVQLMTDAGVFYPAKYNVSSHTLALLGERPYRNGNWGATDKSKTGTFLYSQPDKDHLVFDGSVGADLLSIRLSRIDLADFPLLRQRFSWIHERSQ